MIDTKQPAVWVRGKVPSHQTSVFTHSVAQLKRGGGSTKKRKRKTHIQRQTKK